MKTALQLLLSAAAAVAILAAIPSAEDIMPTEAETAAFCESTDPTSQPPHLYALCDDYYHRLQWESDDMAPALYTDIAAEYLAN